MKLVARSTAIDKRLWTCQLHHQQESARQRGLFAIKLSCLNAPVLHTAQSEWLVCIRVPTHRLCTLCPLTRVMLADCLPALFTTNMSDVESAPCSTLSVPLSIAKLCIQRHDATSALSAAGRVQSPSLLLARQALCNLRRNLLHLLNLSCGSSSSESEASASSSSHSRQFSAPTASTLKTFSTLIN